MDEINLSAARECLVRSNSLIEEVRAKKKGVSSAKESNIRHSFSSYLRLIFPAVPWWIEDHISRGEANSAFSISGKDSIGFMDNLVGLTAIEYEADLLDAKKFAEGLRQVKNYCASLINSGNDPELVLGILSDTVRWRAYKVASITAHSGLLGGEHLNLEELDNLDLSSADDIASRKLVGFLLKHLGRKGSRPLRADTIAKDLGFESRFCASHSKGLLTLVNKAFATNPKYAALITNLWCNFVTYLRDRGLDSKFDVPGYADELYILTLAKLICANVITKRALLSDDSQLEGILDGRFFQSKGLVNLVEYDYFGWLNHKPYIQDILPIARGIQIDLEAYDFQSPAAEDIFGQMMSQLASRSQRLLLGQEWTPSWLAHQLVDNAISKLPQGSALKFVDMCCGSGAIIVEVVKKAKEIIAASGGTDTQEQRVQKLSQSITGFDIDPLAVMLSKISWILASRDWLEGLGEGTPISIPIYHADSLFAITPLSESVEEDEGRKFHSLKIAEYTVPLPSYLLSPQYQPVFDAALDRAYSIAMAALSRPIKQPITFDVELAVKSAVSDSGCSLAVEETKELVEFLPLLINVIDALNRDGRNGLWVFVLRNSYRPGLLSGQFNGLVSNPPWLALSKIADNPYKDVLRRRAEEFGIKPDGQSHLHIELATIFLLHAVDQYLEKNAVVGCIVPDTVLNGHHHNPFRSGNYSLTECPLDFAIDEIWRVKRGTFKNEACILFGRKAPLTIGIPNPIPGALVDESSRSPISFERIQKGVRIAWSDSSSSLKKMSGFFNPAPFRQGADIMPRTLLFHDITPTGSSGAQWGVKPIDVSSSDIGFALRDAKKNKDFRISPRAVPSRIVFDVLISNLLTPFEMVKPLKALLPIEKNASGNWAPLTELSLASTPAAKAIFDEILGAIGNGATVQNLFDLLDSDRKKLTQQQIPSSGFLVFTGAGGSLVCAAYLPVDQIDRAKLIIDQTLYWATVSSEDEAIYLTGLFNSEAINRVIQDFQPRGAFGERHIHKLAHESTPPFDPTQEAHLEVVRQTRKLLTEYANLRAADPEFEKLLNPNYSTLAPRRSRIRKLIKQLSAYPGYELACSNLYGV
jgi:hypothetical protein